MKISRNKPKLTLKFLSNNFWADIKQLKIVVNEQEKSITYLREKLFVLENDPKFKPFDEVIVVDKEHYVYGMNINGHPIKEISKEDGIIITAAEPRGEAYFYIVRVGNDVGFVCEDDLRKPGS